MGESFEAFKNATPTPEIYLQLTIRSGNFANGQMITALPDTDMNSSETIHAKDDMIVFEKRN